MIRFCLEDSGSNSAEVGVARGVELEKPDPRFAIENVDFATDFVRPLQLNTRFSRCVSSSTSYCISSEGYVVPAMLSEEIGCEREPTSRFANFA